MCFDLAARHHRVAPEHWSTSTVVKPPGLQSARACTDEGLVIMGRLNSVYGPLRGVTRDFPDCSSGGVSTLSRWSVLEEPNDL